MKQPPGRRPGATHAAAVDALLADPPAVLPRPSFKGRQEPDDPPPLLVATVPRGKGLELRTRLCSFWGERYVDVRLFRCDRDGAWHALEKGVSMRLSEVSAIRAGLDQLEALAAEQAKGAA